MGPPDWAFAEPFAVHLDLEKFSPKSGLSQILTKMATGSEDLEYFSKTKKSTGSEDLEYFSKTKRATGFRDLDKF